MGRRIKNNSGFTLIEMIIALSIFVLTLVLATNVYFLINNSQRKIVAMQKVQDDVRYLFEAMAQEIRLDTINYAFYDGTTVPAAIDLHPQAAVANYMLVTISQTGDQVFFRRSSAVAGVNDGAGTKAQYCTVTIGSGGSCDPADESRWQDITPEGVEITRLQFFISPSANPFIEATAVSCAANGQLDCLTAGLVSYRCAVDDVCRYSGDGGNFQPKVRMVLEARALDPKLPDASRTLHLQSSISARVFQSKVQNLNYE